MLFKKSVAENSVQDTTATMANKSHVRVGFLLRFLRAT
jgi:hypothetical protein